MKHFVISCVCFFALQMASGQLGTRYNNTIQPTGNMQYFAPVGTNLFVGDCIPYFKDGTYYLYWLIDSSHHASLGGLGGHQWVLSTTKDLKVWKHEPIVLGIDEMWEKSICTGSVAFANNQYYAFYATRLINAQGKVNEQLSYATSKDAIHFIKQKPNPFYTSAPGYSARNFRDPKVVVDKDGTFNLFVSSEENNAAIESMSGAMVHLTSKDLKKWDVQKPILTGQGSVPECPDYFEWNGWYYLVYGDNGNTFYVKSKSPYGPWQQPQFQALNEDWMNVVKTAAFTNNRRIAAGWIPSRSDNKDDNWEVFGGNAAFREVIQTKDGDLATKFPLEMLPVTGAPLPLKAVADSFTQTTNNTYKINAPNGVGGLHFNNVPANCIITFEVEPMGNNEEYGLILHADERATNGYRLAFSATDQTVVLHNTSIKAVSGLDKKTKITIAMKGDIIDVCIGDKRCIVNRLPEHKGDFLYLYAKHGLVTFSAVTIAPITDK